MSALSNLKKKWNQSWSERSWVWNLVFILPKGLLAANDTRQSVNLKANKIVDEDNTVQVEIQTPINWRDRSCKIAERKVLESAQIISQDKGVALAYGGFQYRLVRVMNENHANPQPIINTRNQRLYCIEGFENGKPYITTIWLDPSTNTIDKNNPGQIVKQKVNNKIKTMTAGLYSEKTGKLEVKSVPVFIVNLVFAKPLNFLAIAVKKIGALSKVAIDSLGGLLNKAQDKLLEGTDLELSIEKYNTIEYNKPQSALIRKARVVTGTICGVMGNSIKVVGSLVDSACKFTAFGLTSYDFLLGPNKRATKAAHFTTLCKNSFYNITADVVEVANAVTKTSSNISGTFSETKENLVQKKQTKESLNTVEYGVSKELKQSKRDKSKSYKEEAKKLGLDLSQSGFTFDDNKACKQALLYALQSQKRAEESESAAVSA